LKKSGSIEAFWELYRRGEDPEFSALKKSGSIEAQSLARTSANLAPIFRFEKKRLH